MLTNRQREMLRYLQEGLDNLAIARQTGLNVKTIEKSLSRLYRRLGVHSRLGAVAYLQLHTDLLGDSTLSPIDTKAHGTREVVPMHWLLSTRSPSAQPTILIVDDIPRYRAKIRRIVAACCPEASIDEVGDSRQALQLAESHRPRLAFVNVTLGDESGIACAGAIKALSAATRIVLLNADDRHTSRRLIEDIGAVALLAKRDLNFSAPVPSCVNVAANATTCTNETEGIFIVHHW